MVEYAMTPANLSAQLQLDNIFGSLADATRRDILRRLAVGRELTVGEIAQHYNMSFAAVSKHLKVLERACLVAKRRRGKEQLVSLSPTAFDNLEQYLAWYRQRLEGRLDSLEEFLHQE